MSQDELIPPPSTQPTFKTDYKSNSNRDGGVMTTQQSITLENYNMIMRNDFYNQRRLSPPPLVYSRDKRLLIELAKLFSLRHGYRIVINKNDSRRVILLCSRHGLNKVSSRSKRDKQETSNAFQSNLKQHKCQCPFRLEIQLKQRRKLWILKPINMEHNHEEILQLPITIDNTTSNNLPSETIDGDVINKKFTVTSFCEADNHFDCFWLNNDYGRLLGLNESKTIIIHPDDNLRLINTELINNVSIYNDNVKKRPIENNTSNNDQLLLTELLKVAKRARNNSIKNYILLIKNSNPKNFFHDFPKFSIENVNLEFKFNVIPIDDPNFYNFQLLDQDDKIKLNEDVLILNKEITEITTQDLIKKISDIVNGDLKDDELDVNDDIANITAVLVKAQQQNAKDNELFVDPELTK